MLWHEGRIASHEWSYGEPSEPILWDDASPGPETVIVRWWVKVRLDDGRTGWVEQPEFECMGPLQGSTGCKDLAADRRAAWPAKTIRRDRPVRPSRWRARA